KTWLFQIAFRTACAYRRKLRRAGEHEPYEDRVESHSSSPAEEVERRETLSTRGCAAPVTSSTTHFARNSGGVDDGPFPRSEGALAPSAHGVFAPRRA